MSNRLDGRRNFKAAEIGATENVSSIRWSGDQTNVNGNGSVQSYPVSFDGTAERGLFKDLIELLEVRRNGTFDGRDCSWRRQEVG